MTKQMTEMAETERALNEQLARLQADVANRRARVELLEQEERAARRAVDRARGPLEEYLRRCEADGVRPDADREAAMREEVAAAQTRMDFEPVLVDGRVTEYMVRDREAVARLRGAEEALEAAARELNSFVRDNDVALARERLPQRVAERDHLMRAVRHLIDAERAWNDGLREEVAAAHLAGRPVPDVDGLPVGALREVSGWLRRVSADPELGIPRPRGATA